MSEFAYTNLPQRRWVPSGVVAPSDQTVTINALITHAAIFAPTVQQQVQLGFINQAAVIFAPTVHQQVQAPFITHRAVFAPTVHWQTITPAFITHAQVFAPTVHWQTITPAFLTHAQVFAPQINRSVELPFITHQAIYAPTITQPALTVSPAFLTHATQFAPTINQSVAVSFITHAQVFAPQIDRTVVVPFITHQQVFAPSIHQAVVINALITHRQQFTPSVLNGQTVTVGFITHSQQFGPTITQQVQPGFITHAQQFSPQVLIAQTVTIGFITHAQMFAPVVFWDFYNDFEGGTDDVTITTGNSGGASGNAFTAVSIGAGGTLIFDNAHVVTTMAGKFINPASLNSYVSWTFGDVTVSYGRVAVWIDATPAGNPNIVQYRDGGAVCCSIRLTSGGKLAVANNAASAVATTTTTIATGQWWRVEWQITHSTTTGSASVNLFSSTTASSPTETLTPSSANFGAAADEVRFGISNNAATAHTFWLDIINANDHAKPGPFTLDQTVLPDKISHTAVFAPAIQQAQTVSPAKITHLQQFAPLIHQQVLIPFISPAMIGPPAPTITQAQQVGPGFINRAAVIYAPTITQGVTLAPGFINQAAVIFAPTISVGAGAPVAGECDSTITQLDEVTTTMFTTDQAMATITQVGEIMAAESVSDEVWSLDTALYAVDGSDARAPV